MLIGQDDQFINGIVTNDQWRWLNAKKSKNDTFDTVPYIPVGLIVAIMCFQVPIYRLPLSSRGVDLHFAGSYCDSLLITASGSTFAWWMAFFM